LRSGTKGIILYPVTRMRKELDTDYLMRWDKRVPLVTLDICCEEWPCSRVLFDNYRLGYDMTRQLIAHGARHYCRSHIASPSSPDRRPLPGLRVPPGPPFDTIGRPLLARLDVHLILHSHATHKTAPIHRWLAERPCFHPHFTPTGASWVKTDTRGSWSGRGRCTRSSRRWPDFVSEPPTQGTG